MKVVIVGNGIAGNEVAYNIRSKGKDTEIVIISAEGSPEYDPCSLPYFVSGDVKKEAVFRKKMEDYQKAGIQLILNDKAISINAEAKTIETESGRTINYDKLVLAHGGDLFIPPLPGVEKQGTFSCKKLSEAERLFNHKGKAAVVIGSGAIGIEVAEALKKRNFEVYIVELLEWILPTLCCEPTARRLEEKLRENGIQVYTGEKVTSIEGSNSVNGVKTDKRFIPCDTVVIATGVVPGKQLAQSAGIEVNRGIKTNEFMETNIDSIYACGDCVETFDTCTGEGCVYQLKHNAIDQAQIVAENIAGRKTKYGGAYAFARIHFFDTHAVSFGKTLRGATRICSLDDLDIIEQSYNGEYLRLILKDGKVIGGQAIGEIANFSGLFLSAMRRKDDLSEIRRRWELISRFDSPYPWNYREMGRIMGLTSNGWESINKIMTSL